MELDLVLFRKGKELYPNIWKDLDEYPASVFAMQEEVAEEQYTAAWKARAHPLVHPRVSDVGDQDLPEVVELHNPALIVELSRRQGNVRGSFRTLAFAHEVRAHAHLDAWLNLAHRPSVLVDPSSKC